MKEKKFLVFQSLLVFLCGCVSAELSKTPTPEIKAPAQWNHVVAQNTAKEEPWLKTFNDHTLEGLVTEALKHNFNLKLSAARVQLAQARAKAAGVTHLPNVAASVGGSLRNSSTGSERSNSLNFETGISVSWEADLWDRLGNRARAAALDYEASTFELKAARFSLVAQIGKSWYNAIEAQLQHQLIQQRVSNLSSAVGVIEDGFRNNEHTPLDILLARANLASEKSRLLQAERVRDISIQILEILLGRYPSKTLSLAEKLPDLHQSVPIGLPSELLKRRPDIVAIQHQLAAADERVSEAYKSRYPSLRLTSSLGASSEELSDLLKSESIAVSLASSFSMPLFDGEKLEAEEAQARANTEILAAVYGQTVLQAFHEVESSLVAESLFTAQEKLLEHASIDARAGETLAFEQYRRGLVSFITVLDAQRRSFDAQSRLIELRNQRLQNRITLYLALGGDFQQSKDE